MKGNYNGSISNYSIIYTNKINNFTLNYLISEQYNTHLIMKSSTSAKTPESELSSLSKKNKMMREREGRGK